MEKNSLRFYKHSGIYTLYTKQTLPLSIEKAWEFFSNPRNLAKITPSSMSFDISSPILKDHCYQRQIISYKLSPFPGVKSNWVTEITAVNAPHFFVDEQRFGPYKMWHHEHRFTPCDDGILMEDVVSYKLPVGFIGRALHNILVKPKLRSIFTHRYKVLESIFPKTLPIT